jgi:hypothetical protein
MRGLALLFIVAGLSGCAATETSTFPAPTTTTNPQMWNVSVSPEMAKSLSPDAAKAVLVALAALEDDAKRGGAMRPDILDIRPTRTANGWSVFVAFVGFWLDGKPGGMPGNFCTVEIDKDWNVTRIMGGA